MKGEFSIVAFLSVMLIIIGVTTGIILWFFSKTRNTPNKVLSFAIFGITWALIVGFLIETHLIIKVPLFYRTGHLSTLIFTPLIYIYVRSTVTKGGLTTGDIAHFIPALFYLLDYFPFFILDTQAKRELLLKHLLSPQTLIVYDEGWLTPCWFHYGSRYVLMAFYWVLQARILYNFFSAAGYNQQRHNWLFYFRNIQLLVFFPLIVSQEKFQWVVMLIAVVLPVLFTSLWLFFRPEILYGLHVPLRGQVNRRKNISINGHADNLENLPYDELLQLFHKHMAESNKFLQHGYTIQDMANDLGMHPHHVSHLLNQRLNISFHDFLNQYRIERCIKRISKGDSKRLTLEALSFECGFNNRNSFISAFKRFTGVTPSDYIRSITHSP